ncbi:MAG: diguanylate cyclase, partial [Deinococcota bacterium]
YGLDPTPLGMALSSLLLAASVFRGNFLKSHPISYRTIFLNIAEAVLVLDNDGHIVERNPAGDALTPLTALDQPLSEVLPVHHKVLSEVRDTHADGDMDITTVLEHPPQHFSELKLRPLKTAEGQAIGAALIIRDITLETAQQARLENAAFIDALTGIYNRARFEQLANIRIQESTLDDVIALLYIDLDKFKPVNDTHGHQAGDQVLQAVAQRLQYSVREQDLVARLGGDEFAVLLTSNDPNMAVQTKSRIQQVLSQPIYIRHTDVPAVTPATSDPLEIEEISVNISASIGVAYYPQDGTRFEALLEHADQAMYNVKRPR